MTVFWKLKKFEALSVKELYMIMQLRAEVFVVEQNCPYQDADGKDLKAFHLMGYNQDGLLMAYCRLLPQDVSYTEVSIGRVVSSPKVRGTGIGKALLEQSLLEIEKLFGNVPVRIGAQLYLEKFYESFDFVTEGEQYLEDNIPHVIMLRKATPANDE